MKAVPRVPIIRTGMMTLFILIFAASNALANPAWSVEIERTGSVERILGLITDIGGRAYFPVRGLADYLGATVSWDSETGIVLIKGCPKPAEIMVGQIKALVDGIELTLSGPVISQGNRVMVPVTDLRLLGYLVSVDQAAKVVRIGRPRVRITGISWTTVNGRGELRINTDAWCDYSHFLLSSPDRLVVDIENSQPAPGVADIDINHPIVRRARVGVNRPGVTRVVVDMSKSAGYQILRESDTVVLVRFNTVITGVSLDTDSGIPRVTIQGSGRMSHLPVQVTSEGVYYVDIPNATLDTGQSDLSMVEHGVHSVRIGQFDANTVRVAVKVSRELQVMPRVPLADQAKLVLDIGLGLEALSIKADAWTTTVILQSSGPIDYSLFILASPDRLVVDAKGIILGSQKVIDQGWPGIARVRMGQFTPGIARLVLDLADYRSHEVELSSDRRTLSIRIQGSPVRGRVIMIDPGHGGRDPGAVRGDLFEKHICLDIALKLKSFLQAAGATVVMTRYEDEYVSLADRATMIELIRPDAFISIHANSAPNTAASGTETYYYNCLPYSEELAAALQSRLVAEIGLANRKVERKPYYLVRESPVPSALVEVGFLSNEGDARQLANAEFRTKAAQGIFKGVSEYFQSSRSRDWDDHRRALAAEVPLTIVEQERPQEGACGPPAIDPAGEATEPEPEMDPVEAAEPENG